MSKAPVFQLIDSINYTKEDIISSGEVEEKDYNPFVVNKCLATPDAIFWAQAMNERSSLPRKIQYDFLRIGIPKRKRFVKWVKKEKINNMDVIKQYYGFSDKKALAALECLTEENINTLKEFYDPGGPDGRRKNTKNNK